MRLGGGLLLVLLETAGLDDLEDVAVGRAYLERVGVGLRQDDAAARFDELGEGGAVGDLDAPMMDAGTGACELRLAVVLAVVEHQREIGLAVGHVARIMAAGVVGGELAEAENVLI